MNHPQPIAVPAGLSLAQVGTAVENALTGRGWTITGSGVNAATARLTGNDWQADIRTEFNTDQVSIEYVSSEGLKYDPSAGTINRHWNNWMLALTQDIRANLSKAARGGQ